LPWLPLITRWSNRTAARTNSCGWSFCEAAYGQREEHAESNNSLHSGLSSETAFIGGNQSMADEPPAIMTANSQAAHDKPG
jgi:hypothetical protein